MLLSRSDSSTDYYVYITSTNKLQLYRAGSFQPSTANVNINAWNFITAVFDTTQQRGYINGTLVLTDTPITFSNIVTTTLIGAHGTGSPNNFFEGFMAEVQFYNKALTQTEILAIMNTNKLGNESNLQTYYNFAEQESGSTTIVDKGPHAAGMTIVNGASYSLFGSPVKCKCSAGWVGQDCEYAVCYGLNATHPGVCSTHGQCTSPNVCQCNTGWNTTFCNMPICYGVLASAPTVCSSHGACNLPDNCTCSVGFSGLSCSIPSCYGINATNVAVCSGHGACPTLNSCSCNTGYTHFACQTPICFGIASNISAVCSGNGNCTLPNTCSCTSSYTGSNCSIPICYSIAATSNQVCNFQNGTCTSPNVCNCNAGYTGNSCQFAICSGIPANNTAVCSASGNCIRPNTCVCSDCFTGSNCEFNSCSAATISLVNNANYTLAGLTNSIYYLTVELNISIPTYLQQRLQCRLNGNLLPSLPANNTGLARITCLVSSSSIGIHSLTVGFDTNVNMSVNSISIHIVRTFALANVVNTATISIVPNNLNYYFDIGSAVPDASKLFCRQNDSTNAVPVVQISALRFYCALVCNNSAKVVSLSVIYNHTVIIPLNTNVLLAYFVDMGLLSFTTCNNVATIGTNIQFAIRFASNYLPWDLRTRLAFSCGNTTLVQPLAITSWNSATSRTFTLQCNMPVAGSYNISLFLNDSQSMNEIANNELPWVAISLPRVAQIRRTAALVNTVIVQNITTIVPVTTFNATHATFACVLTNNTHVFTFAATMVTPSQFLCTMNIPSVANNYTLSLGIQSVACASNLNYSTSLGAQLDVFSVHTLTSIAPFMTLATLGTRQVTLGTSIDLHTLRNLCCSFYTIQGLQRSCTVMQSNKQVLQCNVTRTLLQSPVDHTDVSMDVLADATAGIFLTLSASNITMAALSAPFSFTNSDITSINVDQVQQTNITLPDSRCPFSYSMNMTMFGYAAQSLMCTFPFNGIVACNYPNNILASTVYAVSPVSYTLIASYLGTSVSFAVNSNHFIKNFTSLYETPFIAKADAFALVPLTVTVNASQNLLSNMGYTYYCQVTRGNGARQVVLARTSTLNTLLCNMTSQNVEEDVSVNVFVVGPFTTNYTLTSAPFTITFAMLTLSPIVAEKTLLSSHFIRRSNGTALLIPAKHMSRTFTLSLASLGATLFTTSMSCSVLSNLTIACAKTIDWTGLLVAHNRAIFGANITLLVNSVIFASFDKKLLVYTRPLSHPFFAPAAVLVNTAATVRMEHLPTKVIHHTSESFTYFCSVSGRLERYMSPLQSPIDQTIDCQIPYLGNQYASFALMTSLQFPVAYENVTVNTVASFTNPIYYLNASTSTMNSSVAIDLLPTSQLQQFAFSFAYVNFPPVESFLKCTFFNAYLSTFANFAPVSLVKTPTALLVTCAYSAPAPGGLVRLSMTYSQASTQFSVSSHPLDVSYFTQATVDKLEPVAGIANATTIISIYTSFRTDITYGSQQSYYAIFVGKDVAQNITLPLTLLGTGAFQCSHQFTIFNTYTINIYLTVRNTTKQIIADEANFGVIDNFFLEKSFAKRSGNEVVYLRGYNGTDTDVRFSISNSTKFNCVSWNNQLNCTSPNVTTNALLPSFLAHQMFIGNRTLALRFIFYDYVVMSVSPFILPSDTLANANVNITLNVPLLLREGSLVFAISEYTLSVVRVDLGTVKNSTKQFTVNVPKMSDTSSAMELYYKSSLVFELRNSFAISNKHNLYWLSQAPMELIGTNIGFVGSFQVLVSLATALPADLASFVVCKNGSVSLPTTLINTTHFNCQVSSTFEQKLNLSLWISHPAAYQGTFILSSNSVTVLVVAQKSIAYIAPHFVLGQNATVQLGIALQAQVYDDVTYSCRISDSMITFAATRIGNTILCVLASPVEHVISPIDILIHTNVTTLKLSSSAILMSFSKMHTLNQALPVAAMFTNLPATSQVTLSSNYILLAQTGLLCKYVTDLDGIMYVPASNSSTNATCTIIKSQFANSTGLVTVSLVVNTTSLVEISNALDFVFVSSALAFNSTIMSDQQLGAPFALSFAVPQSTLLSFTVRAFSTYSSQDLSCIFAANSWASCVFADPSVPESPVILSIRLVVSQNGITTTLNANSITYYDRIATMQAYPYVMSNSIARVTPQEVVLRVAKPINFDLPMRCMVSGFLATAYYNAYALDASRTLIGCQVLRPVDSETGKVKLVLNTTIVSSNDANIKFVTSLATIGYASPLSGNTWIHTSLPALPTLLFSAYNISLTMNDRGKVQHLACAIANDVRSVNCTMPSSIVAKSIKLDLYMNQRLAVTVVSDYQYYSAPIIQSASPLSYLERNAPEIVLSFNGTFPIVPACKLVQVRYVGSAFSQVKYCNISQNSNTMVHCPSPTAIPAQESFLQVQLSYNEQVYENTNFVINAFTRITRSVTSLSQTSVKSGIPTLLYIFGSNLQHESGKPCIVQFGDSAATFSVAPLFVNSTLISVNVPIFYDEPVQYPRTLSITLIYSDESIQNDVLRITVDALPRVILWPPIIIAGSVLTSMKLNNMTAVTLRPEHASLDYALQDVDTKIRYAMECNNSFICSTNSTIPAGQVSLHILVRARDGSTSVLQTDFVEPIRVVPAIQVGSISPSLIVSGLTSNIIISGNNFVSRPIKLRLQSLGAKRATVLQTVEVAATVHDAQTISADLSKTDLSQFLSLSLQVSFDEAFSWITSSYVSQVVAKPLLYRIENSDDDFQASAYTFKQTQLRIVGKNWQGPLSNIRMRIMSRIYPLVANLLHSETSLTLVNSDLITLTLPSIASLLPLSQYPLRYPFADFKFGISFNNGTDYMWQEMLLLSTFRAPQIINSDIKIVPREVVNITIRGSYFKDITDCVLLLPNNQNVSFPFSTVPDDPNAVVCAIPDLLLPSLPSTVSLTIRNARGELSSSVLALTLYTIPSLIQSYPKAGPSIGDFELLLATTGIDTQQTMYLRVGSIEQSRPCTHMGKQGIYSIVRCYTGARESGRTSLSLSYNHKHWYSLSDPFVFKACKPGWTATTFDQPCSPCPRGFFKPTEGTYSCLICPNNTYTDGVGASSCTACPFNSFSPTGSTSSFNCSCYTGFMVNFNQQVVQRCISCPTGGLCNVTNTTIPMAQFGFWAPMDKYTEFSRCNPKKACTGGPAESCEAGYEGERCARCTRGYYKYRTGECIKCQEGAWWRYLLAVGLFLFIILFFFVFASSKVSQISSISIASSFFQAIYMFTRIPDVNWPSAVDGGFSVASFLSFNIDFLSPECIFESINYELKYIGTLMTPFLVLAGFIFIYLLGEARNLLVYLCCSRVCKKSHYVAFFEISKTEEQTMRKAEKTCKKIGYSIANSIIYLRNFALWFVSGVVTRKEMTVFRDNIFCSYLTFLFFAYSFLMTSATELYRCTWQPDGNLSLDLSPNILCFTSARWYLMAPFSGIIFIGFNACVVFFYLYLFLRQNELSKPSIIRKFKFILHRYRTKYFYWHGLIILRKVLISLFIAFFRPIVVITLSMLVIAVGFFFHIQYIPFRRKFHNLMEYLVLLATLLTLFCGLLLYFDLFPFAEMKMAIQIIAIIIMISAAILVAFMVLWDYNTRRKKKDKRSKKKRKELFAEMQQRKLKNLPFDHIVKELMGSQTKYDENGSVAFDPPLFWDVHHSDDENVDTIGDLIGNLFSWKRLKKKLFLIGRAKQRIQLRMKK